MPKDTKHSALWAVSIPNEGETERWLIFDQIQPFQPDQAKPATTPQLMTFDQAKQISDHAKHHWGLDATIYKLVPCQTI